MARTFESAPALIDAVIPDLDCNYSINPKDGADFDEFDGEETEEFIIELKDSYGGEGMGEDIWCVFSFTDKVSGVEYFVKFQGYYNSWDGSNWDNDPFFVKPVDKVVTFYERIK